MEDQVETQVQTPEVPVEQKKEDLTQIKTLQQMNFEAGNDKAPQKMSQEQLINQLILDHQYGLSAVVPAFEKLGKNAMIRLWTAIMQLPQEGLEVRLNGNLEKQIYMAAQKVLYCKNLIILDRVHKEAKAEKLALAETEKMRQNQEMKGNDNAETKEEAPKEETQNSNVGVSG
jgi:uncharacterized protein YihD (DUF1040 family)